MATQRPEHEIRLGRIVASIWLNGGEDTVTRHNVTVSRLYKPKDGDWKRSSSFGRDDLLAAAKVLDMAHTWIFERIAENAPEPAEAST